jgi:hypothetical protein
MHSTDSQYLNDFYPDLSDTYSERHVDAEADRQKPGLYRPSRNNAQLRDAQSRSDKASISRRVAPSIALSLFAVLMGVGGTLASQSYRDKIIQVFPPFGWFSPASTTKSPIPAVTTADLQEQLKPLGIDLALVRRSIEQLTFNLDQLARKQDQLAQNMATLGAAGQGVSPKASALPLPPKTVYVPPAAPKSLQAPSQ